MNSLFGLALPQPYLYVLALAGILVLLALFAFILRRVVKTSRGLDGSGRGRQPRLGIVDTFSVDRQRQLVIVRRDSVEHLILIGGNSDVVIETNIIRSNLTAGREMPSLPKMPQQPIVPTSTTVEMPPVQDPLPKAPTAPFTATNRQPPRIRSLYNPDKNRRNRSPISRPRYSGDQIYSKDHPFDAGNGNSETRQNLPGQSLGKHYQRSHKLSRKLKFPK